MLKKSILIIFLCLLFPLALFAGGAKEKEWIVPSDAAIVVGIDAAAILDTELGGMLLGEILAELGPAGALPQDEEALDRELEDKLGFRPRDVGRIVFFIGETGEDTDASGGGSFELLQKKPAEVLAKLKGQYPAVERSYAKYGYTELSMDDERLYVYPLANRLLISPDAAAMEAMLRVLADEDDLGKNKLLKKMVDTHQQEMFYVVGFVPPKTLDTAPEIFRQISNFGLSLELSEELSLNLTLEGGDNENASDIANFLKLSLAMAGQMVPQDLPRIREILQQLLAPLKINVEGSTIVVELVYTAEVLKQLTTLLPMLTGGEPGSFPLDSFSL